MNKRRKNLCIIKCKKLRLEDPNKCRLQPKPISNPEQTKQPLVRNAVAAGDHEFVEGLAFNPKSAVVLRKQSCSTTGAVRAEDSGLGFRVGGQQKSDLSMELLFIDTRSIRTPRIG